MKPLTDIIAAANPSEIAAAIGVREKVISRKRTFIRTLGEHYYEGEIERLLIERQALDAKIKGLQDRQRSKADTLSRLQRDIETLKREVMRLRLARKTQPNPMLQAMQAIVELKEKGYTDEMIQKLQEELRNNEPTETEDSE